MRLLLSVLLIAFVARASAQRSLRCFECSDCTSVDEETIPLRQCYGPITPPQVPTHPSTISLTPSTTTTQQPPNVIQGQESEIPVPVVNNGYMESARQIPLFACYTIIRQIGDSRLTDRGCALVHQSKELSCQNVNQGEEPEFCELCHEDDCNTVFTGGARKAFTSISLLFATLFVAVRLI